MKLTEFKNEYGHYFEDEQGNLQGEYKAFWSNGNLMKQGNYKDDKLHGKFTWFNDDGSIAIITYFDMDKDITKQVLKKELLDAILEL